MIRRPLNVLVGCEYTQTVCSAFRERGHNAFSSDVLPTEGNPRFHLLGDVRAFLSFRKWDLFVHHAPCTFILNSGCKHLYQGGKRWNDDGSERPRNPVRWQAMEQGARFFRDLQNADIPHVAGENPIMVGYALDIVGQDYTQLIQPWQFGHPEQKATCLWLNNLPPLQPTKDVRAQMMKLPRKERERVHFASPGKTRGLERSRTYDGIAQAMADQWIDFILNQ